MDENELKAQRYFMMLLSLFYVGIGLLMYFVSGWCWLLIIFTPNFATGKAAEIVAKGKKP